MKPVSPKNFLTAEWHYLAMLNYEIDPTVLAPFVPANTELDFWNGKTFVSVVGFLFQNTRVRGIPIPFHRNFEEVNLRLYVRRKADDGWRRGVVFIKELVPRKAIAFVARKFYNENYFALPMSHRIQKVQEEIKSASYSWRFNGGENFLKVETCGTAQPLAGGSLQEFIAEHYWGYAVQRDDSTMEYRVEHPRWRIWETQKAELNCDTANLYGVKFHEFFELPTVFSFSRRWFRNKSVCGCQIMSETKNNSVGWILYDDSCGFCRRWVPFWENTLRKRGFEIAPLQADWVRDKLRLSENDLLQDLRLLLASGEQIQGANTYRYAMKRIWWAYPIYLFSIAPLGKNIFGWSYQKFAKHRHQISLACKL
jgi:uncharacterized protein